MTSEGPPLSPTTNALLEHERDIVPVMPAVRTRALARAQAAVVASPVVRSMPVATASTLRWAVAAAVTCAAAAAGASGYHLRTRGRAPLVTGRIVTTSDVDPRAAHATAPRAVALTSPIDTQPVPEAVAAPAHAADPRTAVSAPAASRDELRLLSRAREAVARRDFAAALPPIAEHTRRFRDGRLIEEREALRVRALSGLGRSEEARRAATAFQRRFPHSVLSPAVSRLPDGE